MDTVTPAEPNQPASGKQSVTPAGRGIINNMPSTPKGQKPTPVDHTVLRIPLADARNELAEQAALGRQLIVDAGNVKLSNSYGSKGWKEAQAKLRTMGTQAVRWSDYNRTWLDTYLGGEAAEEYRLISNYISWLPELDPGNMQQRLVASTEAALSKLESIHDRLPLWVAKTSAIPSSPTGQASPDTPIFIVHGSDTLRAESVAHTVTRSTGRKTIILRDEPNLGRTLIEKFEQHAAEVAYAVIVLTADDKGGRTNETETRPRARQNVIFEMGYFFGLIGRRNVSVLIRPGVEKPSDMDGIAYITFDGGDTWKNELLRELRHAGFGIPL
jgi:predicted nucleotide-binding protein